MGSEKRKISLDDKLFLQKIVNVRISTTILSRIHIPSRARETLDLIRTGALDRCSNIIVSISQGGDQRGRESLVERHICPKKVKSSKKEEEVKVKDEEKEICAHNRTAW